MQVVFYNNSSGNEHVTKRLRQVASFDVNLKDSCSVQNPVLLLSGAYLNANYCYIADFGRYYYINNATQVRRGLWQYDLKCDVLMSFAKEIKANKAILKRTSQDDFANLYLPDERRMVSSETFTLCKFFPNGVFSGFESITTPGIYNYLVCLAGVTPGKA